MIALTPLPARVLESYEDGEEARYFRLQAAPPAQAVLPGQFFMLTVPGAGEAPFTYVRPPDARGCFDALVRRVGQVSGALFDAGGGRVLGVRGPFGRGWPLAQLAGQATLVVGGGCGLAPLVALVDSLIESGDRVAVIYGARSAPAQVLRSQRGRWRERIALLEVVEEGGEGPGGHWRGQPVDLLPELLTRLPFSPTRIACCGPEAMLPGIAGFFERQGVSPAAIWLSLERRMHCGVGLCGHCYQRHHYLCRQGPVYSWAEWRQLGGLPPAPSAPSSLVC